MIGSFKVTFCAGGTELPRTGPVLDEEACPGPLRTGPFLEIETNEIIRLWPLVGPVESEVPVEPEKPAGDSGKRKKKTSTQSNPICQQQFHLPTSQRCGLRLRSEKKKQ